MNHMVETVGANIQTMLSYHNQLQSQFIQTSAQIYNGAFFLS
jgi:hypothetical protein